MLPRLLCTPLLVLLALAAAPAAHALPARDIAGVALHPWQLQDPAQREQIMAGVAATGVRSVRVDMPWSWVEASGPTVESGHGNWTAIDPIVQAADQHGLTLLPVLGYTPSWASDVGDTWALPDPGRFEDFFAAALRRYRRSLRGSSGTSPTSSASRSRNPTLSGTWSSCAARAGRATAWARAPS